MAPTLAAEGGVHGGVDGGKMRGKTSGVDEGKKRGAKDAGGGAESGVMGCAEAVGETVGETACSWTIASVVALDSPITDRELAACVMACRASCSAIAAKYEEEELCWSSLYMVFIYGLYIGLYGLSGRCIMCLHLSRILLTALFDFSSQCTLLNPFL